jgi:hypothetical protein
LQANEKITTSKSWRRCAMLRRKMKIFIIIIMYQRCLPATGHAERVHKMCGCARKSAEHYFGQRKYGEHTIVLIVCRKKHQSLVELDESEATYSQTTYPTYIHT